MTEMFNAVTDRPEKAIASHHNRRRLWFAFIVCIMIAALVTAMLFAVKFYQLLQQQQAINTQQTQQLTTMQETAQALQQTLAEQEGTLNAQQDTIATQEATIQGLQGTITAQESTIKQLQQTIKALQAANNAASTVSYTGVVTYPAVDTTALAGKKLIALTFDDGPGPDTGRLLDALKARGARATFFLLGSRINSHTALVQRMEAEGHTVGNHSTNHKNLRNLTLAGINTEMGTTAERIKNAIGHYPYVMRCPGGNANDRVSGYAKQIGVPIIYWSIDTLDWKHRDSATVLANAKAGATDGSIILMHDIYSTTVDAAIQLIDDLQAEGYTLVTVPELLAAKHGTIEPGKTYISGHA